MEKFLACPFCRELYTEGERDICPECDIVLRPLPDLPASYEVRQQEALEWEQTPPEDRQLPWNYWQRGRGLLLGLSLAGVALFFAPWIAMTKPELTTLSGFDLAMSKGFWFGGGAIAWLVSIPLIFTRRTIHRMRGVRVILVLFAATTACQALTLALNAPSGGRVPVAYDWSWGFVLSALISVVAAGIATRFGGQVDHLDANLSDKPRSALPHRTSDSQTLH